LEAIQRATTDPAINISGGVVFWSRHSLFAARQPIQAKPTSRAQQLKVSKAPVKLDPRRDLEIIFNTVGTLNYSLLHNRRSLFTEFRVRKQPGSSSDLMVQVALEAGGTSLPCRFTCKLPEDGKSVDLLKHVSTPLIAPLLRRVRKPAIKRVSAGEL
jgi:hypothetical protein